VFHKAAAERAIQELLIQHHHLALEVDHIDRMGNDVARVAPSQALAAVDVVLLYEMLGQSRRAFDMLCERSLSRYTHGSLLAEKQMIQDWVAESYAEMQAARLLTLQAAWKMDQLHAAGRNHSEARIEIATIKFWGARVLYNVIDRAIQVHGSLGYTADLPLEAMYRQARGARIYDGPDEVHKVTVARQVLKRYKAADVPTEHVPTRRRAAIEKFADQLDGIAVNS